jgi:hypothetical protein
LAFASSSSFNTLLLVFGCAQALEEGLTCGELCDKYYAIHKATYDWFDIKFDRWEVHRERERRVGNKSDLMGKPRKTGSASI